jgi:hypothetical protein
LEHVVDAVKFLSVAKKGSDKLFEKLESEIIKHRLALDEDQRNELK